MELQKIKSKGIRILDNSEGVVSVSINDILIEIPNGNFFHWSILFLYAMGNIGNDTSLPDFEDQILKSENGFFISQEELKLLMEKLIEIMDIKIIGCRDEKFLRRYKNDQEMYEACDIVIEMVDSSYWEVYSKNENLINRLAAKFKDTVPLESDFVK